MKMQPLRIEGLRKSFENTVAVQNLNLSVEPGEILTLLGPSGCGKTTTLRLIAGFERPDAGRIYIGGKPAAGPGTWVPPEKRGIGMVFQDYALFPHLTVAENVGFALHHLNGAERARRVAQLLRLIGLEGMEERYPHNLSGGQQQRIALARALAPRPSLVLMDEPFSNLDAALRVQMRDEVRRILKETGAAAILVTHDQKDALSISDRVVVMNRGLVEQVGEPREVYQYPQTAFVAQFVGQTNLLLGEISGSDEHVVVTPIGPVPCKHTHGLPRGAAAIVSIRPDSFELHPTGPLTGRVKYALYSGNVIEAGVVTDGTGVPLTLHIHPKDLVRPGDKVSFRILPDFVAVIEGSTPCHDVLLATASVADASD